MIKLEKINTEEDYDEAVTHMNQLLDTIGDDESHLLAPMLELVGEIVSDYETKQFAAPKAEPKEVLRFMMEIRQTTQLELSKILPQSNLSAILAGKRNISPKVAKGLADYFCITPLAFIKLN